MGISISPKGDVSIIDEMEDKELSELSARFTGENLPTRDQAAGIQVICSSTFLRLVYMINIVVCVRNSLLLLEYFSTSYV